MRLHSKVIGQGVPMVVLHGLFGSGDNWFTIGNKLAESGFEVHLLDLRNHGRSPHDPLFNYTAMSDDVQEYLLTAALKDPVLMGHSMGGKTVMRHSVDYPASSRTRIVVDISPRPFEVRHMEVVEALKAVDFELFTTRKSVEAHLRHRLMDEATVQFLLKNLYWINDHRLAWRFDLESISASIHEVGAEVQLSTDPQISFLFIRGTMSDYILEEDLRFIRSVRPDAEVVDIAGAGHRVHMDQPVEFLRTVLSFLGK